MKYEAILLLGPTGSGKSPLGDCLAWHGLSGRRCIHFDFGAQLRRVAEQENNVLPPDDTAYVRRVLSKGALLENETFHIARTILETFLQEMAAGADDLVILNGLPRHAGQAHDVGEILNIILVVALECTAETVHARIAGNTGGDRTARTDDSVEEIASKLDIYAARTLPLIDHYRSKGVPCRLIPIGINTAPDEICALLDRPDG